MTQNKKVPKFSSEAEEAGFWAKHDTVDYWEDTEEVKDIEIDEKFRNTVLMQAVRRKELSIQLEPHQISLAKKIAKKKNVSYQSPVSSWIEEGIQQELDQISD